MRKSFRPRDLLAAGAVLLAAGALLFLTPPSETADAAAGQVRAAVPVKQGTVRTNIRPAGEPQAAPSPRPEERESEAEAETASVPLPEPAAPEDHVYSHRGASGEEEEHSIAAYDLALLYGSGYLEQDIVLSAEGTLYVSHDLSALRMTGVNALYKDLSDEEIDALRTKGGQRILRLSEVFDRYGAKTNYVIELRSTDALQPFIELVRLYGFQDRIIAQSFQSSVLEKLDAVFPDMPKLYLTGGQRSFERGLTLSCADILSVNSRLMNAHNCELAHAAGKKLNVWTLNTAEEISSAIMLGVDSYFTDYTARALALEEKLRG